jgi:PHD/YefM family antitoxin component YafN of YafNO toxin-antitoxin module
MRRLSISEARARLPELARHVVARPGTAVVIENQRMDEAVVLTSERHLRFLEAQAMELRKHAPAAFTLRGSAETDLGADELASALERLRSEQSAVELGRLADLAEG